MESIKEALIKAKADAGHSPLREPGDRLSPAKGRRPTLPLSSSVSSTPPLPPAWSPPKVTLSLSHLEKNRVVSFAARDPVHVAFNVLRTRVRKTLADRGWKSIAITSPSPGCGKTVVAINLALSLARAPDCRVVLVDLDLRRSAVARALGVTAKASIADFLLGAANASDCFVQPVDNLYVALNDQPIKHAAEMMQSPKMHALLSAIDERLAPDVILFDLPPLRSNDDALAFLPNADAVLMVVGAGISTAAEVAECEGQISQMDKLLGLVLNKCESRADDYTYS